jgi:5'-nucleotidase
MKGSELKKELIGLVDMDGTLCDYKRAIEDGITALASPGEDLEDMLKRVHDDDAPKWLKKRERIIRQQPGWWIDLEPCKLGFDVYNLLRELGFETHVLTKGPFQTVSAWSEKLQWCRKHLHQDTKVTITMDKGLVYGSVLVDDWPPYVHRWLQWRKNGLVIMPAQEWNNDISHRQIVRYDGTNLEEVRERLLKRRDEVLGK